MIAVIRVFLFLFPFAPKTSAKSLRFHSARRFLVFTLAQRSVLGGAVGQHHRHASTFMSERCEASRMWRQSSSWLFCGITAEFQRQRKISHRNKNDINNVCFPYLCRRKANALTACPNSFMSSVVYWVQRDSAVLQRLGGASWDRTNQEGEQSKHTKRAERPEQRATVCLASTLLRSGCRPSAREHRH